MNDILMLVVGLVVLGGSAELLVRCSALIATRLGVSSLLIGLTIVAFGTSAPEIVASVTAALLGSPDIAIGNIVGSNISNSLLVAGAAALVAPIAVAGTTLRRDGLLALAAGVVFWLVCGLQWLGVAAGVALLLALGLYIGFAYRSERTPESPGAARSKAIAHGDAPAPRESSGPYRMVLLVVGAIVGLLGLAGSGQLLVTSAISLASGLGVSEAVIGLTIVAVGTSLPELATSLLAARRGESGIAFGNILGSNIFNLLGIGGLTAIFSQGGVPERILLVDFPIMLAAMALLVLVAATGRRVNRVEGAVLVGLFAIYIATAWA